MGVRNQRREAISIMQNDISQQLCPHDQIAVVVDQSHFPEFVHEVINAGACRAYHFSQDLVTEQGYCGIWRDVVFTQTRKLQENTGEPFLTVIEKLIAKNTSLCHSEQNRWHPRDRLEKRSFYLSGGR